MLSAIGIYFCITAPIDLIMPAVGAQPGEQVDQLLRFMMASGTALFIYVAGYLIYFSIAFRAKPGDGPDAIGVQVHDNHVLEFWWTLIPTLFVVLLSILSVKIWYQIQLAQPANGLVVESLGHQWYFTFRYPQVNGEVTGEMHLPINQPVVLNVTSSDVIHSFWVPAFRLKADMVPGLINTIRFTPTVIGRYPIICTEFCGTDHGMMNAQVPGENGKPNPGAEYVVVDSQADFQKWYHGWQVKNANASNALPTTSGTVALAGGDAAPVKRSSRRSAALAMRSGRSRRSIVGPGLKIVLHDPRIRTSSTAIRPTPADVAKIFNNGFTGRHRRRCPTPPRTASPIRTSRISSPILSFDEVTGSTSIMSATAVHAGGIADHIHPEPQGFVRKYIFSIDHKIIGIQYLITGFVFLILAGLLAEVIRTHLLQRQRRVRESRRVQRSILDARLGDGVARHHSADHRRLRQLRSCRCRSARATLRSRG